MAFRTVPGGEIPPARTPFKIQDPYTRRYVWNRHDNLVHLRGSGDDQELEGLLWELEHVTAPTAETGYLLKNVRTGKVLVDESAGDGRLSRGLEVKEVDECGVVESQIWTMRPLECDGGRRGFGRLYCIQNCRNRAYIANGLQARGKKQLRTTATNAQTKSQAWKFILVSELEPPSVLRSPEYFPSVSNSERPSTSIPSEIPPRILRPKRSGDYMVVDSSHRNLGSSSTEKKGGEGNQLHDRDLYWKRMPPIPEYCAEHAGRRICGPGRRSNSTTAGDSNFLQEAEESWMSQPHWKSWIAAVSDFDISWITPKIGSCTRTALNEKGAFRADGNEFLTESPWYSQPRLEESP